MFWVRATDHPASHCENLHVTCGRVGSWKEFLVLWLKNRQMFSEGTNTVHGVIASSGTGQAVVLACLTKDKPCLDYFKLAYCWVLEPPPNKILSNILMFGSLDPGIKQAMKLVPPAVLPANYRYKSFLSDFLSLNGGRKMQLYLFFCSLLIVCYVALWHEALMPILLPCCRISANK